MKKDKFWNRRKITGTAALFVLVLGGCGVGLSIHNNNVKHTQDKKNAASKTKSLKSEQAEKEAESEKIVTALLTTAIKEPTSDNIKAVQTALGQVRNEKFAKATTTSLKSVQTRLDLINQAKQAVEAYQEDALNATKKAHAQQALAQLKDENDKTTLISLQSKVTESIKQAENARDNNVTKKISFEEIKKGNYNSLSGTWKNELGETLTFTGNQMIRSDANKTCTLSSEGSEYERGVLIINAANNSSSQPEDAIYNTAIYLAPAGFSPNITEKDKTDITKDRILLVRDGEVNNHFSSNSSLPYFYYRISSIK